MHALLVKERVHWHDHWSVKIGERLSIQDSSNDLFIFSPNHSREEIESVLSDIPKDFYRLFEVAEAPEDTCDFQGDSGTCYSEKKE